MIYYHDFCLLWTKSLGVQFFKTIVYWLDFLSCNFIHFIVDVRICPWFPTYIKKKVLDPCTSMRSSTHLFPTNKVPYLHNLLSMVKFPCRMRFLKISFSWRKLEDVLIYIILVNWRIFLNGFYFILLWCLCFYCIVYW